MNIAENRKCPISDSEKIYISSFVSKQLIKDDLLSINKDLTVL